MTRLKGSAADAKKAELTETLGSRLDIFARGSSAGAAIAAVTRASGDITKYEETLGRLRTAGAAPELLKQIMGKAESGDFRTATRLGQSLLDQPAALATLNAALGAHSAAVGSAATLMSNPGMLTGAWSPASAAPVLHRAEIIVKTEDRDAIAREAARQATHMVQNLYAQQTVGVS